MRGKLLKVIALCIYSVIFGSISSFNIFILKMRFSFTEYNTSWFSRASATVLWKRTNWPMAKTESRRKNTGDWYFDIFVINLLLYSFNCWSQFSVLFTIKLYRWASICCGKCSSVRAKNLYFCWRNFFKLRDSISLSIFRAANAYNCSTFSTFFKIISIIIIFWQ